MSYSLNVALHLHWWNIMFFMLLNILPHFLLPNFFSYFPPLKPRCVLWSEKYGKSFFKSSKKLGFGVSYSWIVGVCFYKFHVKVLWYVLWRFFFSVTCLFTFLMVPSEEQILNFDQVQFPIFSFMICDFDVSSRKPLLNPKLQRFSLMLF